MDSIRTLQLLRGDTDSTRSMGTTLGTIACREEGGDILDVPTPGWLCCPAFRYTVEEITNATVVGAIDPLRRGGPTHRLGKAGGS